MIFKNYSLNKHIIKKVLIDIFDNYEISKLYEYLTVLIKNNARNVKIINYNKKNAYQIMFQGKNFFYINMIKKKDIWILC